MLLRPSMGMFEQHASDALALVAGEDRDIGYVAGEFARKEITLDLQVQEAGGSAIHAGCDEEVVLGRSFAKCVFEVCTEGGDHVVFATGPGQVEADETRRQRQNEVRVVGCCRANTDQSFRWSWHGGRARVS